MGEYPFLAGSGLYSERFMQEVPAQAKRLISEVVAQADYEVQRILLFGSRARGEALPDSDWAFFVITDCEPSPEEKRVIQMELIPNFQQRVSAWEEGHWRLAPPKKKVYPGKWYKGGGFTIIPFATKNLLNGERIFGRSAPLGRSGQKLSPFRRFLIANGIRLHLNPKDQC